MTTGKQLFFTLFAGLAAALLVGCSADKADTAKQKVEEARAAVKEVRQATDDKGLWKSTLKILGNAETSLDNGNYKAAINGAEEALFQAQKGLKQYREEQEEWRAAAKAATENENLKEARWTGTD